jgi:hypothetical protein
VVAGQALTVTVTTDGAGEETATGTETTTGVLVGATAVLEPFW